MPNDKQYYAQKGLIIVSFNNYLIAATDLFNAQKTGNKTACTLLENNLDDKWEQWQLTTNNFNDLLLKGLKPVA